MIIPFSMRAKNYEIWQLVQFGGFWFLQLSGIFDFLQLWNIILEELEQ